MKCASGSEDWVKPRRRGVRNRCDAYIDRKLASSLAKTHWGQLLTGCTNAIRNVLLDTNFCFAAVPASEPNCVGSAAKA